MDFDLLVMGGGINGASIARDAQGRGLKTLLVKQDDLASGPSSASSKLIHDGLRYLETYKFRLVRTALRECEVLLRTAPHIIWPLRFYLPHSADQRPRWMIRTGLFLYDNLAKRSLLPSSRAVRFAQGFGRYNPLKDQFKNGFAYSDCWVQDVRPLPRSRAPTLFRLRAAHIGLRCCRSMVANSRLVKNWPKVR